MSFALLKALQISPLNVESGWYDGARTGDWHHPQTGDFTFTEAQFEAWVRNVVANGNRLKLDYDHNTIKGYLGEVLTPEQNKASGHIDPSADNFRIIDWADADGVADGSKVLQVRPVWTPEAKQRINNGEYWGLSVVAMPNWPDPEGHGGQSQGETLLNMALTSEPFTPGLRPLVAASKSKGPGGDDMKIEELRKLLKIGDDVDVKEHLTALAKSAADGGEAVERLAALAGVQTVIDDKYEGKPEGAVAVLTRTAAATDGADPKDTVVITSKEWKSNQDTVTALSATVEEQKLQINAINKAKADAEMTTAVDAVMASREVDVKHRPTLEKQFELSVLVEDPDVFTNYVNMIPLRKAPLRVGAPIPGGEGGPVDLERRDSIVEKVRMLAKKAVEEDKVDPKKAILIVLDKNPDLKAAYFNTQRDKT